MYSTYNEGKSVVAKRFNRALKNKTFKHLTAVSKNVYFDALDDIVNKYDNTVHRTIKVKPIDVTSDSYAEYNKDSNEKDPKVGDCVRISKYENIFAKAYTQYWSERIYFFWLPKLKIQFRGLVISDLNGEPITGRFYEKELQNKSKSSE